MPCEERPQLTEADISERERRWKKKARFLVDESLDQELVQVLQQLGWNASGIDNEGLRGIADESVFARARDQRRLLISKDHDFLNECRFPLTAGGAVAVLPEGSIDSEVVMDALRARVGIIVPLSRAYACARMGFTSRDELKIRNMGPSKSFRQTQRYKLGLTIGRWWSRTARISSGSGSALTMRTSESSSNKVCFPLQTDTV